MLVRELEMLTKRIIPCLDVDRGRVVKGTSFVNIKDAGDPVELAKIYAGQNADEITFLDITASSEDRRITLDVVEQVARNIFIPLTVGGGVRNSEDVRRLLESGADKVSVNSAAVLKHELLEKLSGDYGSQCIVVAVDAIRVTEKNVPYSKDKELGLEQDSIWEVVIQGGRLPTGLDVVKWISKAVALGAGEILLTSMDQDGQKTGYDLELLRTVSRAVNVPLIASGGAGCLEHFYEAVAEGGADALLAASLFHYGTFSIQQVKDYLAQNNVPVRL